MLTLRIHGSKGLHGRHLGLLGLLFAVLVVGAVVAHQVGHPGFSSPPAPAYVSHTSSLVGTADGTLLEGAGAVPESPAPPARLPGLLLAGLAVLGLSILVVGIGTVYTRLCHRLA
ncbi:MAG TPA: hypothetical protein VKY74_17195 [Chloroflexia bacterium]|nr:hypothetical protein [Chloroflexia bacterium]